MENKLINIGPKRGAKVNKRWDPKEWRPEYEAMAALAATGMPQNEIAERFGYTPAWLSMILNSEKGKIVKQLIINKVREASTTQITTERVRAIQERAFKNIEAVINNEEILERSPMAIFGASMEILKKAPVFGDADADKSPPVAQGNVTNIQNNIFANGLDRRELDKSLAIANEVKQLHSVEEKK